MPKGATFLLSFLFPLLSLTTYTTLPSQSDDPLNKFSLFADYVKSLSYPVQTHRVTTEDGYIVTLFRIQAKNQKTFNRDLPVVYLQHGFVDSADTWVINDEKNAPGLQLANKGYDVWFGNARGNKYCLDHVTLSPKNPLFWQFTWQNMSQYDLPATFSYVYQETGQLINYIGHSQGTTIMFAALSERDPTVLQYLKKYIALSPVAWVTHIKSGPMSLMAHSATLAKLLEASHINRFLPSNFLESDFGHLFCRSYPSKCGNFLQWLVGTDPDYDNYAQYTLILEREPGGTSVMDAYHWRQEILQGKFNKYDFGSAGNMLHYNQTYPPEYNVSNINVPVYMFMSKDDLLVDDRDTEALLEALSGAPHVEYKEYPGGHMTFIWSRNISYYFGDLLRILESDESYLVEA